MNKYQKELIEKCEQYEVGTPFDNLYIIPSGVSFDGFGEKTGYNNIYLVCGVNKGKDEKFYIVGKEHQVELFQFGDFFKPTPLAIRCDVPNKLKCVRFFCYGKSHFVIKYVSTFVAIEVEDGM